jgi:6-phospho-3-hexuloisomerase
MDERAFGESVRAVTAEVEGALAQVRAEEVAALAEAVLGAQGVFLAGEGRSGLVARACAMRLMHLGLRSSVAGETTTPAAGPGDLLLALTRSGETQVTRARCEAARAAGVTVALITGADPGVALPADLRVTLPTGDSRQFGGSLFEQAAGLLLDALVPLLQQRLGVSAAEMAARHATLE